jgi:hypothetical protein
MKCHLREEARTIALLGEVSLVRFVDFRESPSCTLGRKVGRWWGEEKIPESLVPI